MSQSNNGGNTGIENEYYGVPLAFVVRLEEFPASQIEYSSGREVLQYRNDISIS